MGTTQPIVSRQFEGFLGQYIVDLRQLAVSVARMIIAPTYTSGQVYFALPERMPNRPPTTASAGRAASGSCERAPPGESTDVRDRTLSNREWIPGHFKNE